MRLKKYLALTRAGIIEALQFRVSMLVMVAGNLLYLTVIYFLWKAIYASVDSDVVNGMTFSDTLIYLVLASALFNFMEMYTVWQIGRDIQSGNIVLALIRPMDFRRNVFWSFSGTLVTNFLFTFLPTFIVVAIVTHGAIHMGLNLLYFVVSVILAILINFSIDFFVSTICIYTESIWGINMMKQVIVLLLSGATIPLAFFPYTLRRVVEHLPFQAVYNAPLSLLLNADPDIKDVAVTLGTQLAWCIGTFIISKLFWSISLRRITVNGG